MRRFASLAVVAIGMIGFVGCGGGGGSSDTSTADAEGAPGTPAAPSAAGPSSSGPGAPDSSSYPGADASGGDELAGMSAGYQDSYPGASTGLEEGMPDGYEGMPEDIALTTDADEYLTEAGLATDTGLYPDDLAGAGPGAGYGPGGEYGPGAGYGQRNRVVPKDYAGKAELAFREGRDRDAMNYLYAHGLTAENGPAENLEKIKWVTALKRPTLAVRWGIGIDYTAPKTYQGDPMAAGKKQSLPQRGRRTGGSGGAPGGEYGLSAEADYAESGFGGGGAAGGSNATMKKYTGDIGDQFLERLTEHLGRGEFGAVLASALEGGGNRQQRGGEFGAEGYDAAMMEGAEYPGGAYPGAAGPAGRQKDGAKSDQPQQLKPGVLLLGLGEQRELLMKAKDQDLDVLVVFAVDVKPNPRTRLIQNETRLELYDVATGERVERTKDINNIKVQIAREDENKDDGIAEELDDLFTTVEEQYKMAPLPEALRPEHVRDRVALLTASKYKNPLPVLTEIQFYNQSKLLADNDMAVAFIEVIGKESAEALVRGELEAKKEVLKAWLPEEEEEEAAPQNAAGPAAAAPGAGGPPAGSGQSSGPGIRSGPYQPPGLQSGAPSPSRESSSNQSGPYQPPGVQSEAPSRQGDSSSQSGPYQPPGSAPIQSGGGPPPGGEQSSEGANSGDSTHSAAPA